MTSSSIRKLLSCLAYKQVQFFKKTLCNNCCIKEKNKSMNVTDTISFCCILDFVKLNGHYLSKVVWLSRLELAGQEGGLLYCSFCLETSSERITERLTVRQEHNASSRVMSYKRLINKTMVKDGFIFYTEELSPFGATARKWNGKTLNMSAWVGNKTIFIYQHPLSLI